MAATLTLHLLLTPRLRVRAYAGQVTTLDDEIPLAHVELAIALQATGKADQALVVLENAATRFASSVELRCFHAEMIGAL